MSQFYINPYNFIPYGGNVERKPRNEETASEPLLTGEIKCSLTVKTPLAIPDAEERVMSKEKEDHYIYPFMTAGGVPIIPGSEIRGMVRNVYEMITNSCFSIINCNILSQRDGQPLKKAGLLQWDSAKKQWQLYEANRRAYFTKTTLNAAKNQLNKEQVPYVVRQWTLFPSLLSSWKEMRECVNKAISQSGTMEEFNAFLRQEKLHFCELYEKEKAEAEDDNPIILCWKKDYDEYRRTNNKVKFDTKRVNLQKKWGAQYSKKNIGQYLGEKNLDERCYDPFISASVFVRSGAEPLAVTDQQMKTLLTVFDFYQEYNKGSEDEKARNKQFAAVLPDAEAAAKSGKMFPVFYGVNEANGIKTVTRLAPAQISRKIFGHTVESLLGRTGHAPCTDTKNLCPACRLFGAVMQSGGGAVSSKLRFSDATGSHVTLFPEKMDKEEAVPTLKELSSPRLTSIEFYSLLSNRTGYKDLQKWDYDDHGVMLRGRKIYLHNPKAAVTSEEEIKQSVFCTGEKTNRNASMQLATDGAFIFSVYFNGITENELKTLVWALTLGDAEGTSALHHKLGHGRPLGLGSVKLQVSEIFSRAVRPVADGYCYDVQKQKVEAGYFNGFTLPLESDTLTALTVAYDFGYAGENHVAYPVGSNGSDARTDNNTMQWFSLNHGKVGKNGRFQYVLYPLVTEGTKAEAEKLLLPPLYKEGSGARREERRHESRERDRSARTEASDNKPPEPFPFNQILEAVITGSHKGSDNNVYIEIEASGEKGDISKDRFPQGADTSVGTHITVKYRGMKQNRSGNWYNLFRLVT